MWRHEFAKKKTEEVRKKNENVSFIYWGQVGINQNQILYLYIVLNWRNAKFNIYKSDKW